MKKMLRYALSLLCAAALSLSLLVLPSSASSDLFFLSVNDTLAEQSTQTTPVQYNGWIYVPVTALIRSVTGVNFGLYYGLTNNGDDLVVYNLSGKTMTFNIPSGTAVTASGETPVPGKILYQNGTYYVPAYAVCRYFGLSSSFYTTEYGPLLRIKDGNAVLSDSLFLSAAASLMRSQINSQNQSQSPNGGGGNSSGNPSTPSVDPNTPVAPEVPEDGEPAPTFSLFLGVRADADQDITATLDAISGVGASSVVFFLAEDVGQCADQIRQAAGRGHKVGLIPAGDTSEQRLESVKTGSRQLAAILRQETWFVLGEDQVLSEAGYLCWNPSLTLTNIRDATATYNTLVDAGQEETGLRLLVNSQKAGGVLAGVLSQLRQDGDTFLTPRETRY